jgi:hypothetical protein
MNLTIHLLSRLIKIPKIPFILSRCYASKPKELTESQKQLQKYASEMQFKAKTSTSGTTYNFHDVETSNRYMNSEGIIN